MLDQVDAWIASQGRAVQIAYEYSGTFVRSDPMMAAGFASMGLPKSRTTPHSKRHRIFETRKTDPESPLLQKVRPSISGSLTLGVALADQGSQGLFSPLLRKARTQAARKWLDGKVLDIGCGSGVLASFVEPGQYVGFDRDMGSIEVARRAHPRHRFVTSFPEGERYDTIVALALIEHLPKPCEELARWASALEDGGKIVITTPHKAFRIVHDCGAKIGIFSADAADEHEEMFDRSSLSALANSVGMKMAVYQRFLFGANQLAVISR